MPDDTKPRGNATRADDSALSRRNILLGTSTLVAAATLTSGALAQAEKAATATAASSGKKPNILIIWGDDIGIANISAYSNGLMGYETPNIDRIGRRVSSSSIIMASSRAPPAVRLSSPASTAFVPA